MIHVEANGISWYLDEWEGLPVLVRQIIEDRDQRRSYFFAECLGRGVFIKHFREKGAAGALRNRLFPRGRREYSTAKELLSRSVHTPRHLGYGLGKSGSFILQERLDGATFLSAFSGALDRRGLLDSLALLLKQLRVQRVRHNDLHLENILVAEGTLFVIDLHKTVFTRSHFSRTDELVNLAHSLAMVYDRMTEHEKVRFFGVYGNPSIRGTLETRLDSQHAIWIERKANRAFSTTSLLKVADGRVYVRGCEGRGDGGLIQVLKRDKKVVVERHADHVRKIYGHRRRLRRAWENCAVLLYLAMPVTPDPFFVQKGSLFRRGFMSMEDLDEKGKELDRFLDGEYDTMERETRRGLAKGLAAFFGGLLEKGVIHLDLKACNLFVLKDGFRLLDVEDFAFRRVGEEDIIRLCVQLNTSIPVRIGTRDRIGFFCALVKPFSFDKKGLLREVERRSSGSEVVYEGAGGLKRETWKENPTNRP